MKHKLLYVHDSLFYLSSRDFSSFTNLECTEYFAVDVFTTDVCSKHVDILYWSSTHLHTRSLYLFMDRLISHVIELLIRA